MSGFQYEGRVRRVYTAAERTKYARRARQLIESSGLTMPAIARELGLCESTLYNWLRRESEGGFLPVSIVPEAHAVIDVACTPPACLPVLVAPGGYRVEGLDVASIALLLRQLS
jgi:transposase-like protein